MISTHKLVAKRGMLQWFQCLLICAGLAGCAVPPPALVVPNTGSGDQGLSAAYDTELAAIETAAAVFRVIEYPLVEQSTDNPDNPDFASRAMQAVADRRAGFGLFRPVDIVEAPNQAMAPYGYQISHSTTAPFSTYVLLYNGTPVVRDISRFWQLDHQRAQDFLLVVETLNGDLIAASNGGVETVVYGPAQKDERLAYAGSGAPMITGGEAAGVVPGSVFQQEIDGKTLALYHRDRLAHISYAGEELPFTYDALVYAGGPESAIYNPGASGRLVWFYALRDGLWYYVEAGIME